MKATRRTFLAGSALTLGSVYTRAAGPVATLPPAPYGALPAPRQLRWQRMATNAFLHFGVNTFTDREWGNGDENPSLFNPTAFDPDAIILALKAGGMQGAILTCKHHDGFCLWPTRTTEHCIRNSSWKQGKGDVVLELSQAAKRHGLKFGVYVSPWDRNNPNYGKPGYLPLYRQQITELLTHYGPIFEIWFDGANGGLGYYGGANETRTIDKHTFYDWPNTWALVRKLQPEIIIESDAGLDGRWVGNESGVAGETCWATFDPVAEKGGPAVPGDVLTSESSTGTRHGAHWIPAECDVSIRPGWFWHQKEDAKVKTPAQLIDLYFKSVGRGAVLLLNVPPNRAGLISQPDRDSLAGFHQQLQAMFSHNLAASAKLQASNTRGNSPRFAARNLVDADPNNYWATDDPIADAVTNPTLTITFAQPTQFDVMRLGEADQLGQRIDQFTVEAMQQGAWTPIAHATSVGSCRLIRLDHPVEATQLRLRITAPVSIALADLGIFLRPS